MLRFHWKWSDYEINQVKHMQRSFREILETIGGTVNAGRSSSGRRPRQEHHADSGVVRRAWAPAAA